MTTATDRPTTARPTGVAVMAAVAVISGVVDILAGLGDIGMGGGFLGDRGFGATIDGVMTIVGVGLVLVGILGVATGYGLWTGRNWAWLIARVWASVCILVGVIGVALSFLGDGITTEILAHDRRIAGSGRPRRSRPVVPLPAGRQGDIRPSVIRVASQGRAAPRQRLGCRAA